MTYSIVARDPLTHAFGVATATGGPCVGALVPHVQAGVGAIATQGDTNPLYGADGLELLRDGTAAEEVVRVLTAADPGRERRQFVALGRDGAPAVFVGREVEPEAGFLVSEDFAVAGNMLRNAGVIEAMTRAFEAADGRLEDRLLAAMQAGEGQGGDKRGTRSAALLVYSTQAYADFDCRVDLSDAPVAELAVLLDACRTGAYGHFLAGRPRRDLVTSESD